MLSFCPEAEKHLEKVMDGVSEEEISSLDVEKGKRCIVQLYYYCAHIRYVPDHTYHYYSVNKRIINGKIYIIMQEDLSASD